MGGRNAAVVLVSIVQKQIHRVLVRGGVNRIRRRPSGGVIVPGGGKCLGGQQSHTQAERQDHAQNAGKVFRFSLPLDPAYLSATTTGVEYSGNAYTVVYNVAPAFHRYVGTTLDNHVSVTAPGSYGIIITVDSAIYDNVELRTAERLLVYPKSVPWTAEFDSKIYDGNSLLDGKTVTYLDVNGVSVPAALSACQVKVEGGELTVDTAAPVTRPVAAGPYAIGATITDDNYVWQTEDFLHAENGPGNDGHGDGDTAKGRAALGNDRLDLGGSGLAGVEPGIAGVNGPGVGRGIQAAAGGQPHRLDGIAHIDGIGGRENPGQGINRGILPILGLPDIVIIRDGRVDGVGAITKGGASFGRVTIPVTVVPRPILSVEEVVRTAPMGTAFNKLGLPASVSVVAEGGTGNAQTVTGVPVTWSSTGYDPYALTQTVRGTLNLSRFPQLSGDNIPAVTATINLTYGTVEAPTVSDYAKTYDGQSTALPLPGLPEGIRSVAISYKGTTNSGRPYSSASAPVNAGSYTATVSFVMEPGYPQLSGMTVSYTIEKEG